MWICSDNQDVGLEAAIIERVRNSSLVKWCRAENVSGLKVVYRSHGLWTLESGVVGEHPVAIEAAAGASRGRIRRENAGMSNERRARNPSAESPRVPG